MNHSYTQEQIDWLISNAPGRPWREITDMFNQTFGTELSSRQLQATAKRRKIKNGIDARYKNGHLMWGYKEIGSERVNPSGYIEIKVNEEPKAWKSKHKVIWEQKHGAIPEGHVVIFADKNTRNFDIDNLILVSRKQLIRLNQNQLIKEDAELTKTGVIIADIIQKIHDRKKGKNK